MSQQVFTVRNRDIARNVFRAIGELFGDAEQLTDPVDVVIKPHKKDRSLAQNRLAFRWYKELAEQRGTTPEYEHRFAKLRHGCPILIDAEPDFADFYRRGIESLDYERRILAMQWFPVTRLFTVKQMREYLDTLEKDSIAQGMSLSRPEDTYYEAMGRE